MSEVVNIRPMFEVVFLQVGRVAYPDSLFNIRL